MTAPRKLAYVIASLAAAIRNCEKSGNAEWKAKHSEKLDRLVREHMPSGSGFDAGTHIDLDRTGAERITFSTSFHHMDENGCYDGWTDHVVTVRPCLIGGLRVKVSGRDKNGIKDYIAECFDMALSREIEE